MKDSNTKDVSVKQEVIETEYNKENTTQTSITDSLLKDTFKKDDEDDIHNKRKYDNSLDDNASTEGPQKKKINVTFFM